MKKLFFVLAVMMVLFIGCEKVEPLDEQTVKVQFGINLPESTKKSATTDEVTLTNLHVRINNGWFYFNNTPFIPLIKIGNSYVTPEVNVLANYPITAFLLLDANNQAIYGIPTSDSPLGDFVSRPLPLTVSSDRDFLDTVIVDVVSTEGQELEYFGVNEWNFNVIDVPEPPDTMTVTDIDGNVYQTVQIGNQTWMAENLRVTKFNDGTPIKHAPLWSDWAYGDEPRYSYPNQSYADIYGYLYNGYVGINWVHQLAMPGWRVPTKEDWEQLRDYLGGWADAGVKLKSTEWPSGTNESGFSALPGGKRTDNGNPIGYEELGMKAYFWTSSYDANNIRNPYGVRIFETDPSNDQVQIIGFKRKYGFSVRLIKDE
jgi:uncharacterized protein (TIGR02145 family)